MLDPGADGVPSVEIVAVPFHRFRRKKWALVYFPADGSAPERRTSATFEDALQEARTLALAERIRVRG